MTYSVKNSALTTTYTVNDNTQDTADTSLTFIGKNYAGYGLALNENFLYLLENFSNTVGNYPLNPVPGQLFWDNTNKYMHVYDGAAWKVIYGALASLTVNSAVSFNGITTSNGGQVSGYLTGAIGANVANSGVFTTVTTNNGGQVSGYLTGAIGANTANSGIFTTVTSTGNTYLATSSGNVGIGTSSPITKLTVQTAALTDAIRWTDNINSTGILSTAAGLSTMWTNTALGFGTGAGTYTERMRIDSSGNMGIGTASPSTRLSVVSSTNGGINVNDGTVNTILYNTSSLNGTIGTTTNHPFAFYTNNTEKMRIDSSGNVGIGTTTVTANLVVYGSATGTSQARVGNSIVQIQDGLGRVVANFLGGVDGTTKPTYATLNLGGAASTPIAFSLATTHGVSIGSNSATISTTGVVAAPTINAGTIGNTGTTLTGTLSTAAQTNITSVGTLSGLISSANITAQTANMYAANHIANTATYSAAYYWANGTVFSSGGTFTGGTISSAIVPSSNASINIGGTGSQYFNNVYAVNFLGTSTTAKYADLAEKYLPDAQYDIGTVMMVGGTAEVTQHSGDRIRAIGVTSAYPAYKMNSDLDGGVYVALKGRVPVRVVGPVKKGQSLFGTAHGLAMATDDTTPTTFAIALEGFDGNGIGVVEAVIL